ncbi:uncharacterized protein LOC108738690 [Agrilus planipennis]|uniref:Uncharacterized protein LOC108738690 n=1 Tax=Agrilus planipennis TaxID=224129 RepID=A0A1W4WV19_AGRPL|nr:uncharacterized protein LOC108738690 [Agrilus planipennis]
MENVYKIKVRTNPDPNWLYPSERRYSASTVLGLGVVHLALALTALLLACLTLAASQRLSIEDQEVTNSGIEESKMTEPNNQNASLEENAHLHCDSVLNLTLAPCIMCLGALAAGLTALLAWKRWYIDQNIKWFFIMSIFSSLTASVCLIAIAITMAMASEALHIMDTFSTKNHHAPSLKLVVAVNVFIASVLEFTWSILSSKIAYKGMINDYPDDIVISKQGGRKQISTVRKGNCKGKLMPPDILNHFPFGGVFSKYFPNKKENEYLPKEESHSEYQERVHKFLASQNSMTESIR